MRVIWNGQEIGQSDQTVVVEGNHYFPAAAIGAEYLQASEHRSFCPWKGEARYYHVVVDGKRNDNAAWYYPEPKPAASEITDRIAFWRGVEVTE